MLPLNVLNKVTSNHSCHRTSILNQLSNYKLVVLGKIISVNKTTKFLMSLSRINLKMSSISNSSKSDLQTKTLGKRTKN
jgi:hypothetical protein